MNGTPPTSSPSAPLPLASHLALYPALYTLGVYLLATTALGFALPSMETAGLLLLLAHTCYLLDRVKISDARLDPADAMALPDRAAFFARHARQLRVCLWIELLLATTLALAVNPWLGPLPSAAMLGVYLYAGRGASPERPRPKDLPALKSALIACAHIALVVTLLWSNGHPPGALAHAPAKWVICSLWLIVCADAILCDLDDLPSDAAFRTRSLPVLIGLRGAWGVSVGMLTLAGVLLSVSSADRPRAAAIGSGLLLTGLVSLRHKNRRDLIDARLPVVVLVGLLIP